MTNYETLKEQLLSGVDEIIKIILKGNTVEIKKNKDGIQMFEVSKNKLKKNSD